MEGVTSQLRRRLPSNSLLLHMWAADTLKLAPSDLDKGSHMTKMVGQKDESLGS